MKSFETSVKNTEKKNNIEKKFCCTLRLETAVNEITEQQMNTKHQLRCQHYLTE